MEKGQVCGWQTLGDCLYSTAYAIQSHKIVIPTTDYYTQISIKLSRIINTFSGPERFKGPLGKLCRLDVWISPVRKFTAIYTDFPRLPDEVRTILKKGHLLYNNPKAHNLVSNSTINGNWDYSMSKVSSHLSRTKQ